MRLRLAWLQPAIISTDVDFPQSYPYEYIFMHSGQKHSRYRGKKWMSNVYISHDNHLSPEEPMSYQVGFRLHYRPIIPCLLVTNHYWSNKLGRIICKSIHFRKITRCIWKCRLGNGGRDELILNIRENNGTDEILSVTWTPHKFVSENQSTFLGTEYECHSKSIYLRIFWRKTGGGQMGGGGVGRRQKILILGVGTLKK